MIDNISFLFSLKHFSYDRRVSKIPYKDNKTELGLDTYLLTKVYMYRPACVCVCVFGGWGGFFM